VYGKENGQWILVDSCKGYVGYKGCVDGTERMQNTNKTPLGIYRITYAMGIAENPGTIFPYTQIVEGMYWDLNDYSDNYNRLVYTDPKGDREVLWKMGAQYNYVLNTSYNENQVVGKGGAIFIHCSKNEPTAGCVSMPEENMKALIKWVDPSKNPVMLSCLTDDVPAIN
jgi:L,D-peptidoglycan transpeptidase YkuD (ErfK/YbiS/YcfS/YnhG family)